MSEVLSAEKVDPGGLSEQQRRALSERLYPVHAAVFSGLDEMGFDHYVVNSPATETRLLLYRNRQAQLIGYLGVHRFDKHVDGQPFVVFRAEVGLLPGYRQRDANLTFWLMEAARFKLRNPGRSVCFLYAPVNPSFYAILARYSHELYPRYDLGVPPQTLRLMTQLAQHFGLGQADAENPGRSVCFLYAPVNPSFYAMLARYSHELYPRHDLVVPPQTLRLMTQLAQHFGLGQADAENPLIRRVGWITKATRQEESYWRSTRNPHIRYYIDSNPHFTEGNGLLTLMPITLVNLALSFPSFMFHAVKKKFRATRTSLEIA